MSSATFQPRAGFLPGTFLFPVTWRCLAERDGVREAGTAALPLAPESCRFAVSALYLEASIVPPDPPRYEALFQKPASEPEPAVRPRARAKLTKRILEAAGLAADARTGFRPPRQPRTNTAPAAPQRAAAAAASVAPGLVPAPPPAIATPVPDPPESLDAPLRWQMFVPKSDRRPALRAAPAAPPPPGDRIGSGT